MTDKELEKYALDFRKGILGKRKSKNMCVAVSAPLASLLYFEDIQNCLVEGILEFNGCEFHHYWIDLGNGKILDPTADQFNEFCEIEMPPVYIGEKPNWYNL